METAEASELINLINRQVVAIIRGQQTLADVKSQLTQNIYQPFEQDYIYSDHFGSKPSEPKTHEFDGVIFTTRILHQTGTHLSDIKGADMLYEIEGEKFILVQYKRPDKSEIITIDVPQLEKLISSCPLIHEHPNSQPPKRLIGWCGSWYCVRDNEGTHYVPACEARSIAGAKKSASKESFRYGLSLDTFTELFASCRIGAPINVARMLNYVFDSLAANHLVFFVSQFGEFEEE